MSTKYQPVALTSERLKEAMTLRGKKQIDLVRETGIDTGSISHYLSGRYEPKQEAVNKLAIVLNVSEMWLWGYDVPMERELQKNSPSEPQLTEGEQLMLELFRKIPADRQREAIDLLRVALRMQQKP